MATNNSDATSSPSVFSSMFLQALSDGNSLDPGGILRQLQAGVAVGKWPSKPSSSASKSENKPAKKGVRGRKRKFASYSDEDEQINDDSSEEFSLEGTKTKSGRKVQKPAQYDPSQHSTPARRRTAKKGILDPKACRVCQRGHSPQSNVIVFCSACNAPYHQHCHDPAIPSSVVSESETDWLCNNCSHTRRHGTLITGMSGKTLTESEKRTYLSSLSVSDLVELILFCESQHPDTPLYNPKTKSIVQELRNKVKASTTPETANAAIASDGEMPNYEELIPEALESLNDPNGSPPKHIFEWILLNYPSLKERNVRGEATTVLHRLLRHGNLTREGHNYRVNPLNRRSANGNQSRSSSEEITFPLPAPGSGIKLPPDSQDAEYMVEKNPLGFSHAWQGSTNVGEKSPSSINEKSPSSIDEEAPPNLSPSVKVSPDQPLLADPQVQ